MREEMSQEKYYPESRTVKIKLREVLGLIWLFPELASARAVLIKYWILRWVLWTHSYGGYTQRVWFWGLSGLKWVSKEMLKSCCLAVRTYPWLHGWWSWLADRPSELVSRIQVRNLGEGKEVLLFFRELFWLSVVLLDKPRQCLIFLTYEL